MFCVSLPSTVELLRLCMGSSGRIWNSLSHSLYACASLLNSLLHLSQSFTFLKNVLSDILNADILLIVLVIGGGGWCSGCCDCSVLARRQATPDGRLGADLRLQIRRYGLSTTFSAFALSVYSAVGVGCWCPKLSRISASVYWDVGVSFVCSGVDLRRFWGFGCF